MQKWMKPGTLVALVVAVGSFPLIAIAIAKRPTPPTNGLPIFEKDASWPKPLPNGWFFGQVTGISVDDAGHIWVIHRPGGERLRDSAKEAAREAVEAERTGTPAPRVVEFDKDGSFVQGWGGPSSDHAWPQEEHGITADTAGHIWISGHSDSFTPPGPDLVDTEILKFSTDGKFLAMFGKPKSWGGSSDKQGFGNPTNMRLNAQTNELFVSDGEANHRVVVVDATTGAYKRHWGAYGGQPDDTLGEAPYDPSAPPAKQFGRRSVHCLLLGSDSLVYVCDRANDRVQVFREDGTFLKEGFVARETRGVGSVWSLGLSPDRRFLYVGDGSNQKIWILNGETLEVLGSFAEKGSRDGEVGTPHSMAVDALGNIYTAYPLTKWKFKGVGPAKSEDQR
jgi:DNA-binding beta-propeller fold protein YncE